MIQSERRRRILDMIARKGEVSVELLARAFAVSEMTIRRDLTALEHTGKIRRMHGGALLSRIGVVEFAFEQKRNRNTILKQAIAAAVLNEIKPGMTVLLDTGTTTLEIARAVGDVDHLTVLTTSLAIASVLHGRGNIELILLGGTVQKDTPDLSGPLTEENLSKFRVNLAVMGADGAQEDGVFTASMSVAHVARAILAAARRAVLAVDHTKFGAPAFVKYATWSDFALVVTDDGVPADVRQWLDKVGPEIVYARGRCSEHGK